VKLPSLFLSNGEIRDKIKTRTNNPIPKMSPLRLSSLRIKKVESLYAKYFHKALHTYQQQTPKNTNQELFDVFFDLINFSLRD